MVKQGFMIKVQAIFKLFDNYTSKAATNATLTFILPENLKMISKGDGYFVLIGENCKGLLSIKSAIYESVDIILDDINDYTPISLWLTPSHFYPAKFIHFKAKAKSVYYSFLDENNGLRLCVDYEKGNNNIAIYNEQTINLVGRAVVLFEEGSKSYEIVKIREYEPEQEEYVLEHAMCRSYKKRKTKVIILYYATSNKEGICRIAMPDLSSVTVLDLSGVEIII